jgi:hypothetical protein
MPEGSVHRKKPKFLALQFILLLFKRKKKFHTFTDNKKLQKMSLVSKSFLGEFLYDGSFLVESRTAVK